ncbi:glycoside hydrolase family 9 protein [Vibrio mediterranei]|uniref:glycoside hydrolase family 9 protein n=1 Tax=Vibrio mediterranei TaxID=689 RepID=UPI001EFCF461|nr:glycoside hydrolase family 9 protein [Vibrio mediterranei]MCG9627334.1 glycoside hydrolase family 9 protein [Vibrio mediterranei]
MKGLMVWATVMLSWATYANDIVVNQLGYEPSANKRAYWVDPENKHLDLLAIPNDAKIARFPLTYNSHLPNGKPVYVTDFSVVTEPGWYFLKSEDKRSVPFEIKTHVYQGLQTALVHALFLQRSGEAVYSPVTGMARPPSHIKDGEIFRGDEFNPKGKVIDASGGWYDAGDFGKYIATATITVARMLEAYRQSPNQFASPNGAMPSVLVEALYELNWMMKMQRKDGAVYRKLSGATWPAKIPPWLDTQTRYIYGVSTPDTAKFAATLAFASRIYQPFDKALSKQMLATAELAWRYLDTQPEQYIDWQKEDDSGSGPYIYNQFDKEIALETDVDDRIWAAAELYITTNKESYLSYVESHYSQLVATERPMLDFFEWKNPALMGVWHIMIETNTKLVESMKRDLDSVARDYAKSAQQSPFYVANRKFIWGSNKMVAEIGILLAWRDIISGKRDYQWLVQAQLDYLLGANGFNMSYVTHFGTHAVRHLHHLYRIGTGVSLPGFLVGGPNIKGQAGIAPKDLGMLSYVDDEKSYAVNEFAIDYNAALIGLLAVIDYYQDE